MWQSQTQETFTPIIPWPLPFSSALGSLSCPRLMGEGTGTKISNPLLLDPDNCHPTNDPQVGSMANSWLGDQNSSPLSLLKMPLQC